MCVPPWLRWRALREGHRRMRELAVSERRALSGRSEQLPVPVSGWLFRKSVPGETRLPPLSQTCIPIAIIKHLKPLPSPQPPLCQHCCIFGFVVKFSCPTLLNSCCSTVLLFKRECFVEAAPGYSGIHSSVLKPRLRGRLLCLCLVFPPSSKCCACVVSWHSL